MTRKSWILVIVAAVIVLCAVLVPLLVNAKRFRPTIESRLSSALSRPVQIGTLSFSWLAGGLSAQNIAIGEDPSFGTAPFLTARALDVNVEMWPLLLHRELRIESIKVRDPEVHLQELNGRWNVSTLGPKQAATSPASGPERRQTVTLRKLSITDGRLLIGTQTYSAMNLTATDFTPDTAFPFTLSAQTPGSGKLKVEGTMGPIGTEFTAVPVEAKLQLERLDLSGSGYFGQGSGIAGTATLHAAVHSNGRMAHVEGNATAEGLRLSPSGNAMRPTAGAVFTADYDLKTEVGRLTRGSLQIGKSAVGLSGTFDLRNSPVVVQMTALADAFPMTEVQHMLPALGVTLPGGTSLQGGTATTTMSISGPVDRLVVGGPLRMADVTFNGFDLGSNLKTIAALAGINTGRDTRIQSLTCNYRVAPEGTSVSDLNAAIVGLGTLTGGGSTSANHALDFRMTAHLAQGGGVFGSLLKRAGVGQLSTVPFRITGTTTNPRFAPDVNAIMQTSQQPTTQEPHSPLGGLLNQLFRKKK